VERALEAALRVEDEVAGGDDALALVESPCDHAPRCDLRAYLDLTRFEIAVALVPEHVLARAGVERGVVGHDETLPHIAPEYDVDERLGPQVQLRVRELQAHLDGPRLRVHER